MLLLLARGTARFDVVECNQDCVVPGVLLSTYIVFRRSVSRLSPNTYYVGSTPNLLKVGVTCNPRAYPMRATMRSGRRFIRKPSGAHGQEGTYDSAFSFSIAATSARQPVSVSTMNGVFFTFSLISLRM